MSLPKITEIDGFQPIWRPKGDRSDKSGRENCYPAAEDAKKHRLMRVSSYLGFIHIAAVWFWIRSLSTRPREGYLRASPTLTWLHWCICWGYGIPFGLHVLYAGFRSMKFSFSEEQEEFRSILRRFLEAKSPTSEVRRLMETDSGYDPDVWKAVSQELGLTALHIPEAYGGSGFGVTEIAIACEEAGRALLCAPFFASTVMAATAIMHAGSEDQKQSILPRLASGEIIGTLAVAEDGGDWLPASVAMTAAPNGSEFLLSGSKSYVLDGNIADLIVVAALTPSGQFGLFVVDAEAQGLTRISLNSMDPTRKLSRIEFDRTPAQLLGQIENGKTAYEKTLDVALICLANEMVGGQNGYGKTPWSMFRCECSLAALSRHSRLLSTKPPICCSK